MMAEEQNPAYEPVASFKLNAQSLKPKAFFWNVVFLIGMEAEFLKHESENSFILKSSICFRL